MGRNKIGLDFKGWEDTLKNFANVADETALKKAVEAGLKTSKDLVNKKVTPLMAKSNLPAGGLYSSNDTKKSLDRDFTVNWSGYTGEIKIGFDFSKSGLTSIFLMYGTPKHKPPMKAVPGLYEAFYGKKTKKEIKDAQQEAVNKFIERYLG